MCTSVHYLCLQLIGKSFSTSLDGKTHCGVFEIAVLGECRVIASEQLVVSLTVEQSEFLAFLRVLSAGEWIGLVSPFARR